MEWSEEQRKKFTRASSEISGAIESVQNMRISTIEKRHEYGNIPTLEGVNFFPVCYTIDPQRDVFEIELNEAIKAVTSKFVAIWTQQLLELPEQITQGTQGQPYQPKPKTSETPIESPDVRDATESSAVVDEEPPPTVDQFKGIQDQALIDALQVILKRLESLEEAEKNRLKNYFTRLAGGVIFSNPR